MLSWIKSVANGDLFTATSQPKAPTAPPTAPTQPTAPTGPGSDTSAPKVTIVSPAPNARVPGKLIVAVSATDDRGVKEIRLKIDGRATLVRYASAAQFSIELSPGVHTLRAEAYDGADNVGFAEVRVQVELPSLDRTAPSVQLVRIQRVQGRLFSIVAEARDAGGVTRTELYINAKKVAQTPHGRVEFRAQLPAGTVALHLRAYDRAGNSGAANAQVVVPSDLPDTTAEPAPGCSLGGAAPSAPSTLLLAALLLLALARRQRA